MIRWYREPLGHAHAVDPKRAPRAHCGLYLGADEKPVKGEGVPTKPCPTCAHLVNKAKLQKGAKNR